MPPTQISFIVCQDSAPPGDPHRAGISLDVYKIDPLFTAKLQTIAIMKYLEYSRDDNYKRCPGFRTSVAVVVAMRLAPYRVEARQHKFQLGPCHGEPK